MIKVLMFLMLISTQGLAAVDSIEIIKHRHELNLIKNDKIIKSYTIALGRQPQGRKVDKNDKRTPEGVYKIKKKIDRAQYHKSLLLNYPTLQEKADAQARGVELGEHLCIHGMRSYLYYMPDFLQKLHRWIDWTTGCIALTNSEIDEIFEEVEVGTSVVIYE